MQVRQMAKFEFTHSQKEAIESSGQNILVAASAGSGKTRVLVERVISHIKQGIGIDTMLIVTFTEAAAKEMKDRVQKALQLEINNAHGNEQQWYVQQLSRLNIANISTLHAFCLRLIEKYYYLIDLDPVFRMLTDETERTLLRDDVWDDLREEYYMRSDELFERLTQNFSDDRSDDGLSKLVFKTFDFANANSDFDGWLDMMGKSYSVDADSLVESQIFTRQLKPIILENLTQARRNLTQALKIAENQGFEKWEEQLQKDMMVVSELETSVETTTWNEIRVQLMNFSLGTAPRMTKLDDIQKESKEEILGLRTDVKKRIAKLVEDFFLFDEQQQFELMKDSEQLVLKLVEVVQNFAIKFAQAKRQRHVLDFSDLEHFALSILSGNTADKRKVRSKLQEKFSEIMIDEYQDTNQLQETLIGYLAKDSPGNMFMVGDVKQSIYGFRLADPTMFLEKYQRYSQSNENSGNQGKKVILAENFRSVKNVTDFINLIFKQLMDYRVGELDYDEDAQLKFGAKYYPELSPTAEILIYESGDGKDVSSTTSGEAMGEDFIPDSTAQGQILAVISKIKELIAQNKKIYDRTKHEIRELTYGDIVLLVPTRNNNLLIMDEFQKAEIPVFLNDAQNYFQTTEIQIMLSFLKIIDNPLQDIPLVSVLRSPIVGLKENALAYLRINQRTGDYYQALQNFWKNFDGTTESKFGKEIYVKVDWFMNLLNELRNTARKNELAALIWKIYEETGFLDYVGGMPGGMQRQANLHALYERASAYEKTSFKGLFQFVRFIDRMQKQNQDLAEAAAKKSDDAVQVMTIHGSKGLEFPAVFLMDANHQFNEQNLREDYLLDVHDGIGISYLDDERVKKDTLPKMIIKDITQKKLAAEQMRLLYVALTRSEQLLYIVGTYANKKTAISTWKQSVQDQQLVLNPTIRQQSKNFMDWIGMCLTRTKYFKETFAISSIAPKEIQETDANFSVEFYDNSRFRLGNAKQDDADMLLAKENDDSDNPEKEKIKKLLNFEYPDLDLTITTAYQAVSEAKRVFADPAETELPFLEKWGKNTFKKKANRIVNNEFKLPVFFNNENNVSAAQVGTATHLVLQKIKLGEAVTIQSIEQTISNLVKNNLLEKETAKKIEIQSIDNFFMSNIGQLLLNEPQAVNREVPFSMLMPVSQLFPDVETNIAADVLIHGIIDVYIEIGKEVILLDYKTDYIRQGDVQKKKELVNRYKGQLKLYAAALENELRKKVTHKFLYLLSINELVEVL